MPWGGAAAWLLYLSFLHTWLHQSQLLARQGPTPAAAMPIHAAIITGACNLIVYIKNFASWVKYKLKLEFYPWIPMSAGILSLSHPILLSWKWINNWLKKEMTFLYSEGFDLWKSVIHVMHAQVLHTASALSFPRKQLMSLCPLRNPAWLRWQSSQHSWAGISSS